MNSFVDKTHNSVYERMRNTFDIKDWKAHACFIIYALKETHTLLSSISCQSFAIFSSTLIRKLTKIFADIVTCKWFYLKSRWHSKLLFPSQKSELALQLVNIWICFFVMHFVNCITIKSNKAFSAKDSVSVTERQWCMPHTHVHVHTHMHAHRTGGCKKKKEI